MTVTQLTISIPNKPGDLAKISELLGDAGVNILAILVSTTTPDGDGLVRFVADNPERATNVLDTQGHEVASNEVIAADTPHNAGGLLAVLKPLKRAGVNIDYLYPCTSEGKNTIVIIGVQDDAIAVALNALRENWIALYGDELYHM
ncbi:MAG: ACT domain-containing protein [Myxococcota bacterium]|nr:ACT domain-containing protein [Myxococcota bacterium]